MAYNKTVMCGTYGQKLMDVSEVRVVIASDVSNRDGIGVELYHGDEMLMEIFRDDTMRE